MHEDEMSVVKSRPSVSYGANLFISCLQNSLKCSNGMCLLFKQNQ